MAVLGTEALYWVDADANEHLLGMNDDYTARVLETAGFGMVPFKNVYRSMPLREGVQYVGMVIKERIASIGFLRVYDTRQELWDGHQTILGWFNPDLGAGYIKQVFPDASWKKLNGRVAGGLTFNSKDQPTIYRQIEVVQIACEDPFWYASSADDASDNFDGVNNVDIAVNNQGQWKTYPTITVSGAVNHPVFELLSTEEKIDWNYNNASGDFVIVCGPGNPTITKTGVSEPFQYLSKDSEFPALPRGADTVRISSAAASTASCTISWIKRYLGV